MQRFRVDLKTFWGLAMPNQYRGVAREILIVGQDLLYTHKRQAHVHVRHNQKL